MGGHPKGQGVASDLLHGATNFYEKTKANVQKRLAENKERAPKSAGRKMTEQQALEIREDYEQALLGIWGFMDDSLKFVTGGHKDPDIWRTIDEGDLKIIVDSKLRRAQHDAKAAKQVYRTIDLFQRGAVYLIYGPRMWQTLQFLSEEGIDLPLQNPFSSARRRRRKMRVMQDSTVEGSVAG